MHKPPDDEPLEANAAEYKLNRPKRVNKLNLEKP